MRAGRYYCVLRNVERKMTSMGVEREGLNRKDLVYEIKSIYSSSTVKIPHYE